MTQAAVRKQVISRAGDRCENCQRHQEDSPLVPLQIEHVIPQKHGGDDSLDNLALACIDCNLRKGSNLTGIDPETNVVTRLFHPRLDHWRSHFSWDGAELVGLTAIGRTTVRVMSLNSDDRLEVRVYAVRPPKCD